MEYGWMSLIPPLLAILLAVTTRHVYLALIGGLVVGYTVLAAFNPFSGLAQTIDGMVNVMGDAGDARVVIFTLIMGALIGTLERGGGVAGFVSWVESRRWVTSGRRAQMMSWLLGIVIFIESNITVLVAGTVSRPLYDRYKVSREKLAYLIDSTCAPICILIPLNAWGAYNLGLLGRFEGVDPLSTFIASIGFNFYAIFAVLLALWVIVRGFDIGPMKKAEQRTRDGQKLWPHATPMVDQDMLSSGEVPDKPLARNMVVPIAAMILMMFVGLYITGDGNLAKGSGSKSILWASLFANAVAWGLLLWQKAMNVEQLTKTFLKGAGGLVPLALMLLLALAMGDLTNALGTGPFVAGMVGDALPSWLLLPVIFLAASLMAFSIGSSWGTFAIMMPIAVPVALVAGLPPAPFVAAVLSGGIFGDHASPISDTTVVASMASATDHIDHVKTQLPYALLAGVAAALAFTVVGAVI